MSLPRVKWNCTTRGAKELQRQIDALRPRPAVRDTFEENGVMVHVYEEQRRTIEGGARE